MKKLQRSTQGRGNSPVFQGGTVILHEIKKEIYKSQSLYFYHQRKQILHKSSQDGCQNPLTCVGTWLQSSVWKCLVCASSLGGCCIMYFTEVLLIDFCCILKCRQRRLLLSKGLRQMSVDNGYFCFSVCCMSDAKFSCSVTKGEKHLSVKQEHTLTLPLVFSICLEAPGNQHVVVSTFSQNSVNARHSNELHEITVKLMVWTLKLWLVQRPHSPNIVDHYLSAGCDSQPDRVGYHFTVWVRDNL